MISLERTWRVLLPAEADIDIMLVGVGGTGSHLAPAIASILHHRREQEIALTLIDHDVVEARNIGRQNFCHAEIGLNKAQSMAWRLNAALGLTVAAFPERFRAERINHYLRPSRTHNRALTLLVGCVDNHLARRELADCVDTHRDFSMWWLDCGNGYNNGHVTIGNSGSHDKFELPKMALGLLDTLPAPHVQEPALLEPDITAQPLSCAELTMREEQSLMVNRMTAAIAADVVGSFALRRELKTYATYFNLNPPIVRSVALIDRELQKFIDRDRDER